MGTSLYSSAYLMPTAQVVGIVKPQFPAIVKTFGEFPGMMRVKSDELADLQCFNNCLPL